MAVIYLIGLGLSDPEDITIKGLNAIKRSEKIYLEHYTSILNANISQLEKFYNKKIIIAHREMMESEIDSILAEMASKENQSKVYSFLVVGDPFCATTHHDIFLRATKLNLQVKVIHNASILNAIAITGLQIYNFGRTVSVPFFTEKWKPCSFLRKIWNNYNQNMHTLVLLDIRVRERTLKNIMLEKKIYEPPKFMSVNVAVQ